MRAARLQHDAHPAASAPVLREEHREFRLSVPLERGSDDPPEVLVRLVDEHVPGAYDPWGRQPDLPPRSEPATLRRVVLTSPEPAATLALWAWQDRPWAALGLIPRLTWGLAGVAVGFAIVAAYVLVQRKQALEDGEALARLRRQMRNLERMMPRSDEEGRWFGRLAVTAGICEELLYRGYLIWYLSHWIDIYWAAALASLLFGVGHAYQGVRGILTTTLVGLFLSAVYLLTGSLYPGMIMHALMDAHSGHLMQVAYERERSIVGPGEPSESPA